MSVRPSPCSAEVVRRHFACPVVALQRALLVGRGKLGDGYCLIRCGLSVQEQLLRYVGSGRAEEVARGLVEGSNNFIQNQRRRRAVIDRARYSGQTGKYTGQNQK